jgi:hypothetical protein
MPRDDDVDFSEEPPGEVDERKLLRRIKVNAQPSFTRTRITCVNDNRVISYPAYVCPVCKNTYCDRCAKKMAKNNGVCSICYSPYDGTVGVDETTDPDSPSKGQEGFFEENAFPEPAESSADVDQLRLELTEKDEALAEKDKIITNLKKRLGEEQWQPEQQSKCARCGASIVRGENRFCPYCGAPI